MKLWKVLQLSRLEIMAYSVFRFLLEPNISKGLEYEKYQYIEIGGDTLFEHPRVAQRQLLWPLLIWIVK